MSDILALIMLGDERMVNILFILVFVIVSLICIIVGLATLLAQKERKEWNDGICPQCGETWQLLSVESIDGETCRHYICKNKHKAFCYMIEDDIEVNDNIEKE